MSDETLRRLEDKLDHAREELTRIREIQAKQHVSLEEHMRRTEAAEEAIADFRSEIAPIRAHIAGVQMLGKAVGVMSAGVAMLTGMLKLLGKI